MSDEDFQREAQEFKQFFTPDRQELYLEIVNAQTEIQRGIAERLKDPRRDLYTDCGWLDTEDVTPPKLRDLYQRFPIAARSVDLPVDESWRKEPEVFEDADEETITEFEKAWSEVGTAIKPIKSFYNNEAGNPVWEYCRRADKLSRVGHYSVIMLEFDDVGKPKEGDDSGAVISWSDPAPGFESADAEGYMTVNAEKVKGTKLIGMRVFDEENAKIVQWNDDQYSPMYDHPLMYELTFFKVSPDNTTTEGIASTQNQKDQKVHWSRVIHVVDNTYVSDYVAVPAMLPILNNLMDLQKTYAASGEGFWRMSFPGIVFESNPNLGGKINIDIDKTRNQMNRFQHTAQKQLVGVGGSYKTLSGSVTAPTAHVESQIEAICIYLGCPVRIFKGSERGELASSQDKDSWDERMVLRQNTHITPTIIAQLIDRLILAGVLPVPTEGYGVKWPDLTTLSQAAKMDVANKMTEAMTKYIGGGVDTLMSPQFFLTNVMDFTKEEAEEIIKAAVDHINQANPEEDDVDVAGRNPKPAMSEESEDEGSSNEEGKDETEESDSEQDDSAPSDKESDKEGDGSNS